MERHLRNQQIITHPFVIAKLALGSLVDRLNTLAELDKLPRTQVARMREVRLLIETHALYSRGIGFTDVNLIASCLLTPGTELWTRDTRLASAATHAGVAVYGTP